MLISQSLGFHITKYQVTPFSLLIIQFFVNFFVQAGYGAKFNQLEDEASLLNLKVVKWSLS